jgi:hypothetical protein
MKKRLNRLDTRACVNLLATIFSTVLLLVAQARLETVKHQAVDTHWKLKVKLRAFQYFGAMMRRVVTFPIQQLYPEKRVRGVQRTE